MVSSHPFLLFAFVRIDSTHHNTKDFIVSHPLRTIALDCGSKNETHLLQNRDEIDNVKHSHCEKRKPHTYLIKLVRVKLFGVEE